MIKVTNFNHQENLVWSTNSSVLFQIFKEVNECNTTMYYTTSGLYLTNNLSLNFENNTQFESLSEFVLADTDYRNYMLQTSSYKALNIY